MYDEGSILNQGVRQVGHSSIHTSNARTQKTKVGGLQVTASLGCIVRQSKNRSAHLSVHTLKLEHTEKISMAHVQG